MATRITLFICDKNSSKINIRTFELTDYITTRNQVVEIFNEADSEFGNYFYDAESDTDITDEERELLRQLDINEALI